MPAVSHLPPRDRALSNRHDPRLRVLLGRLLETAGPGAANHLRIPPPDTSVEDLLGLLEHRAGLQRSSVASLKELTSLTDRAVCLPRAGPPVLLAAADQGGRIRVDFGGWIDPPLVREAALDGLFPCVALFVDGSGIPAPRPVVRPGTLLGATLRFLSQLLGLALPLAMMLIIDKVVNQGAHNTLLVLLMGVALLTAFQFLFQWVHAVHVARTTELLAHPERVAGLDRVLGSRVAGELAMNGWEALQGALENGLYLTETRAQFYADVGFLVLLVVLMAAFDAVLLVVAVAVLPFCVAIEAWSSRRTRNASEVVSGLGQHLSGRYFELTAAARLLHAMNLGGHVVAQWQAHDTELALARHRLTLGRRVASLVVECLQRLSVLPVMLLGVTEVMQGSMTLGQYIAFNLLALQFGQPVLRLAGCWRARDDHQRRCDGREHLRRRCEETAWPRAGTLELPDRGEWLLSVRHLTTAAGGVRAPLSFDLLAGRWLGITGRSGCGKSTLLRVLAGVETPAHGEVVFNGVPILQLAPAARGRLVRLLPQAPVMFSASIAENIGLGDPAAGPEAILTAARVCGVSELAEQLPGHLNTIVGPAGRQLSGGEQQRVALARAVLSRPRLLLLDEATAGLDEAGEARLLADLRRFLPETAVVLVSHRASTLAGCPQVLDLVAPAGGPALNVVAD